MGKWVKRVLSVLSVCLLVSGAVPIGTTWANAAFNTAPMLSIGEVHALALKSDGTVWAWGGNACGELGDNSYTDRHVPVQVLNLSGILAVSAGMEHSLALKSDGTVWAWGWNQYGQLGDNSTVSYRTTPVQAQNLSDIIAISAGVHSLALKSDGTVWAWGWNDSGQLGDNSTTDRRAAVQVQGLNNVVAITAGKYHSLALKSDGTVWAWGRNTYGQLGDNSTTSRSTPVQVHNLNGMTKISIGGYHSLALKSDGTVWAWGRNTFGELGDNTTTNRNTPVQVQSLSGVTAIEAGWHSLALKNDGTVWAWGPNDYGQLGIGVNEKNSQYNSPVQVHSENGVIAIAAGTTDNLALKGDGTVFSWGWNYAGALGDNSTTLRNEPVQVKGPNNVGYLNLFDTYSITYNANGGTGAPGPQTKTYSVNLTLSLTKPTRIGYEFLGWSTSSTATTVQYTAGGTYGTDDSATFYAVWKANTYNVSYNSNKPSSASGIISGAMANSSHTYDTAKNLTANAFGLTGYTFQGWATSAPGGVVYTNSQNVTNLTATNGATVPLYAVWKANTYTIAYNANEGTGSTASSSHTYDAVKNLTSNGFSRSGYTFQGWATSASGGVVYTNTQSVLNLTSTNNATFTLFAVWQLNAPSTYTISYDANGGAGAPESQIKTHNTALTLSSTKPTRTGYEFLGWSISNTASEAQYLASNQRRCNDHKQ